MATLMAIYNSEGCVGRCDATCYAAKHQRCTCICGGRNHGVGRQKAEANVREAAGLALPSADFLERRLEDLAKGGPLVMVDRLEHPDAKRARAEAWMRINQSDLFREDATIET